MPVSECICTWQWYIQVPAPPPSPACTWKPNELPGPRSLLSIDALGSVGPSR